MFSVRLVDPNRIGISVAVVFSIISNQEMVLQFKMAKNVVSALSVGGPRR